jgi:hypothetical protein
VAVDYENLTDEDYFGMFKMLFNTEGWEVLMIELQEQAISINDVQMCKDTDDLRYKQGQLNILGKLLRLEETLRRTEEELDEIEV